MFFESALQSGNLLGSVFRNARFGFDEGVDSVGVVAVLVAWAGGKSAWSRNSAVGANVVQCRGTYAGIVGYLAASGEGVGIVCVECRERSGVEEKAVVVVVVAARFVAVAVAVA